jgi:hypothetical protein
VPDIVNNHLVLPDFIHDQIIADGKPPEARFACCLAHVGRLGDQRRDLLDASNKTRGCLPAVLRYICEDLIEIGKRAALIPELHAPR